MTRVVVPGDAHALLITLVGEQTRSLGMATDTMETEKPCRQGTIGGIETSIEVTDLPLHLVGVAAIGGEIGAETGTTGEGEVGQGRHADTEVHLLGEIRMTTSHFRFERRILFPMSRCWWLTKVWLG